MINHDHKIDQFYYVSETLVSDNLIMDSKNLKLNLSKNFNILKFMIILKTRTEYLR